MVKYRKNLKAQKKTEKLLKKKLKKAKKQAKQDGEIINYYTTKVKPTCKEEGYTASYFTDGKNSWTSKTNYKKKKKKHKYETFKVMHTGLSGYYCGCIFHNGFCNDAWIEVNAEEGFNGMFYESEKVKNTPGLLEKFEGTVHPEVVRATNDNNYIQIQISETKCIWTISSILEYGFGGYGNGVKSIIVHNYTTYKFCPNCGDLQVVENHGEQYDGMDPDDRKIPSDLAAWIPERRDYYYTNCFYYDIFNDSEYKKHGYYGTPFLAPDFGGLTPAYYLNFK